MVYLEYSESSTEIHKPFIVQSFILMQLPAVKFKKLLHLRSVDIDEY